MFSLLFVLFAVGGLACVQWLICACINFSVICTVVVLCCRRLEWRCGLSVSSHVFSELLLPGLKKSFNWEIVVFYCCFSLHWFVLDATIVVWEERHLPLQNLVNSNHRRTARICNVTYIRKDVARLSSNQNCQENFSCTRIHQCKRRQLHETTWILESNRRGKDVVGSAVINTL